MVTFALLLALASSEVDPYYAWLYPPRDETAKLNAVINDRLAAGLADVNRRRDRASLACRDVAWGMASRLLFTSFWYPIGEASTWRLDRSPRTRSEIEDRFHRESFYRYAPWPLGSLRPIDPAVRVGDVLLGTDKIGHFFTRGIVYYDQYLRERADGKSEAEAERAVILQGFVDESTWLGLGSNGVLSYGDLEANYQGLRFYRDLCESKDTGLVYDVRWRLAAPFDIRRWVTPCFDEVYNPSAYSDAVSKMVRRAVQEACPRLRTPAIERRLDALDRVGCTSDSAQLLSTAEPRPWSFRDVCR